MTAVQEPSDAGTLVDDGALTVPGASEFTGIPRSTLYELMTKGKLRTAKVGRRRLIPRKALVELLKGGLVGA